jgi:hypothetical protein
MNNDAIFPSERREAEIQRSGTQDVATSDVAVPASVFKQRLSTQRWLTQYRFRIR